jgi:hypothetical protein
VNATKQGSAEVALEAARAAATARLDAAIVAARREYKFIPARHGDFLRACRRADEVFFEEMRAAAAVYEAAVKPARAVRSGVV